MSGLQVHILEKLLHIKMSLNIFVIRILTKDTIWAKFGYACVCKTTLKHVPQPLRIHMQIFLLVQG